MSNLSNDLANCEKFLQIWESTFRGATFSGVKTDELSQSMRRIMKTSAQRTWVGLTDEEKLELYRQFEDRLESDDWEYEKAIEAKLKEKNT